MAHFSIIGGSGFIGTRLCQRIEKDSNSSFSILDKTPSLSFKGNAVLADVRSVDSLHQNIPDDSILVNLAAEHRDDVRPLSLYDEVNVDGANNICTVAREKNVKLIVFTSTVAVYGFSPLGTDESGKITPFNDYGRTKHEAEQIFKTWQAELPNERTLVIVRPTVVFGEGNRGNVYNLLKQIASGRFLMFGDGKNIKSMAYVENLAAFIEYSLSFKPGVHIYNYIDKPDFEMNRLISEVRKILFRKNNIGLRLPAFLGIIIGYIADVIAKIIDKPLPVSSIRVKKFMHNTQFETSISETGFIPPVSLEEGLARTLRYEFLEDNSGKITFETE